MMNFVWAALALMGIGFAFAVPAGGEMTAVLLNAAMEAVALCVRLAGGFAFWNGLMAILEDSGAVRVLVRWLRRPLQKLFPGVAMESEAGQAMTMNLAANMLGLGNAATPMGVQAMRLLGADVRNGIATDAMCMFLVINATSIQLFPGSVIALRAAAGAQAPTSIVWPTLVATAASTLVGVGICLLWTRRRKHV